MPQFLSQNIFFITAREVKVNEKQARECPRYLKTSCKKIIFLGQVRDYGHTRSSNPPQASSNLRVSESATNAGSVQVTHGAEKTRATRDHNLVARITRTNTTNRITRYHGVFLRRDITDKHFHMVTLLAPVSFFFCFKKKEKKLQFRSAEETLLIPGCTCRP